MKKIVSYPLVQTKEEDLDFSRSCVAEKMFLFVWDSKRKQVKTAFNCTLFKTFPDPGFAETIEAQVRIICRTVCSNNGKTVFPIDSLCMLRDLLGGKKMSIPRRENGEIFWEQVSDLLNLLNFVAMTPQKQELEKAISMELCLTHSETPVDHNMDYLEIDGKADSEIDLSRFFNLTRLKLWHSNLSAEQWGQIKGRLEELGLYCFDVAGFDFTQFSQLRRLRLSGAENLIARQLTQVSAYVGGL